MNRLAATCAAVAALAAVAVVSAAPKFTSTFKSPDAASVSFAGKTVAALVITQDQSLRMSGEESLVRELTGLGLKSVATYRIAPKEELQDPDRARAWFDRVKVDGVVAMRPVSKDKQTTYTPAMWMSSNYSSFWGYYGYGWNTVYMPGYVQQDTIVVVETTIYSVPKNALLWAAVSETRNPKTLQKFVEDLVKQSVKELKKQGLARNLPPK